ncbi:gluconeogenesis factor YvcK family protein [Gloeobacter violaceus]|uniref:Putative gluconeogenesis factor n=1 Tax=Gloeobacter violaceus (strain ATCC 29082 / PCC 7421) TaxID=251221 RepID=Q7NDR8_GLOVI|nr:gluconeogenesis factor YvcK family protein [Gloeobacter violaceus]BAC92105.1 glr4164 [Gloeobacter violaceus PCC 7421]
MSALRVSKLTGQFGKWLYPGMRVKRWLGMVVIGTIFVSLGLAIWVDLRPIFYSSRFLWGLVQGLADLLPNDISGPLVLAVGLLCVVMGLRLTLSSITEVLVPEGQDNLVERLYQRRRLSRGPKIVAIGGGTGLSTLLRGLKRYSTNITAVVTVADDGGSSGRLRQEFGVLPPGDLRNCLAALADEEKLLTELFQYRFKLGEGLAGHSFGNLFLTAMAEITGDLEKGVEASSKVLAIRGRVLPATLDNMTLWADLEDGRHIEGESNISHAGGQIVRIGCTPVAPRALPQVAAAIREAELVIIGPGSLYTSIAPNLLVPEIAQALKASSAHKIYICNVMTQPGESDGYSVSDHVRALEVAAGGPFFEAVMVQKDTPTRNLDRYAKQQSQPVTVDRDNLALMGLQIVLANVMDEDHASGTIRHSSQRLGRALLHWYKRRQQNRQQRVS